VLNRKRPLKLTKILTLLMRNHNVEASYDTLRRYVIQPARVRSPKDKARVENQVPYVRESWFDGETFASLEQRSTDVNDYPRGKSVYALRSVDALIAKAKEKGKQRHLSTLPRADGHRVHDHYQQP
jgi:hypothetical protein